MENKLYIKRENVYQQIFSGVDVVDKLPIGIYRLHYDSMKDEFSLELWQSKFSFDFKLYGIDMKFVNHVIATYKNQPSKSNIGVLLNGEKGAGKTVTAKFLCNELNLPVIICDTNYKNIDLFISSIDQDCIFFFDEFEKNFKLKDEDDNYCAGENLLSVMDGLNNSDKSHIFILTTNNKNINSNLMSRPSRIRYIKEYESVLDKSTVVEYLNDNLLYKEHFDEIINLFKSMDTITMDMLKCVVDEVNMHNCPVSEFKDIFNFTEKEYEYYGFKVNFTAFDEDEMKKTIDMYYSEYEHKNFDNFYASRGISFSKPFEKLNVGDRDYYDDNFYIVFCDLRRKILVLSNNGFEFEMYVFPFVFEKNKHLGKAEKSWLE